jgi:hypothetical protein
MRAAAGIWRRRLIRRDAEGTHDDGVSFRNEAVGIPLSPAHELQHGGEFRTDTSPTRNRASRSGISVLTPCGYRYKVRVSVGSEGIGIGMVDGTARPRVVGCAWHVAQGQPRVGVR